MTELTLLQVKTEASLSHLLLREALFDAFGSDQLTSLKLSTLQACTLFVAGVIEQSFLQPEQKRLVRRKLQPMLVRFCQLLDSNQNQFFQFVFLDSSYMAWTGETGFLCLETGEMIEKLPFPPLETLSYNVGELYRRKAARCQQQRACPDK